MKRSRTIKIGWLLPYSGIFRNLKKDLQQSLQLAMQNEADDVIVESYPEFIQTGAPKPTEDALKKLLIFEQVDLVVGITSSKVALGILPLAETNQAPLLIMNLGADLPVPALSSDYLFYNSLHLWKSEWSMGKWSQQQFGGEPAINMSVYEGGYHLHESFKAGTARSGATTVKLNILRNPATVTDTTPLIDYLRTQQPSHAHVLLSGKEGRQFLQLFHDSNLYTKSQLSVNPFMIEDHLAADLPPGLTLYSAATWSSDLENDPNRAFVRQYTASFDELPHAFSLLAYEAGLFIAAATRQLPGPIDRQALREALSQTTITSPRGSLSLSTRPLQINLPVYIRQTIQGAQTGKAMHTNLAECAGIEWNDPSLQPQHTYLTGWQNPYLCV